MIGRTLAILVGIAAMAMVASCGGNGGTPGLPAGFFTRSFSPSATADNVIPFGGPGFGDVTDQEIYTATEVGASGRISALRFSYFASLGSAVNCPNTTIRIGHTSLASPSASFANNFDRGTPQTVLDNATVSIPAGAAGEWFTISLATPFNYNGVDNLLIQIDRTTACSGDVHIAAVSAAANRRAESDVVDTVAGTAENNTATADYVDPTEPLQEFTFEGGVTSVLYGGSTSNAVPFATSAAPDIRHSQFLYYANEVKGSGPITGIAFVSNAASTFASTYSINVKLGHSTLTGLGTDFAANFDVDAPAAVASNLNFVVPAGLPAGSLLWIPLTGSFSYNGTDNLIVDIEVSGAAGSTFLRTNGAMTARRLFAAVGAATGSVDSLGGYDTYFRFNGATMDVMPNHLGASYQVFGSPAGGQAQNLYRSASLGTGGTISSVALRFWGTPTPTTVPNYKIYMGHTSKTALSTADTYASNMDGSTLVYTGSLVIPAGLAWGDWITIPLQHDFVYDPGQNLVVMFSGDDSGVSNSAEIHVDASAYAGHLVGRDDNTVDTSGLPTWGFDGAFNIRFGLKK